ncbi:MAG: hypothetical protein M3282_08135 [Gemmatimonadota bacterium]|nr:hypothetical protein [Gemmatimonadota bacterium]
MSRKRARPAIRDVIAERVFHRADGREVRVVVGRPRKANGEWVCEFRVLGVGRSKVYSLPGPDSLEALQLALAMMAVQVESYQQEHGLTFMGGPYLPLMKPDFAAMMREIEAAPEFPQIAEAIGDVWQEMTGEPLRRGAYKSVPRNG